MAQSTVEFPKREVIDATREASIRVLHVDDEAGFLKAAKQMLKMQGPFQVDTASSVDEANEKMKEKAYDVVICDYIMPRKDGLQFLKELRDSGNNIPFIIFTGKGREEVVIKALNLGADQYIGKIGNPETVYCELAHAINQALESKKAEDSLRKSEEKYRSLVEDTSAGVISVDPEGRFTFVNKGICEVIGYSEKELLGKHFIDFVHPDDRKRIMEVFLNFFRNPELNPRFEFRVISKKGRTVHLHSSPTLFKYKDKIVGFHAIITDITERKRAEKVLEFQRDVAVILSGARNLRESVNRLFDKFLEFEEFDCAGFYLVNEDTGELDMILHRRLPEKFVEKVGHLEATSPYTRVAMEGKPIYQKTCNFPQVIKKDLESEGILSVAAIPIQYKGELIADLNLASHTHDEIPASTRHLLESTCAQIGEAIVRSRMEARLQESEREHRHLLENLYEGIWIIDKDAYTSLVNSRMAEMLGYTPDEMRGKHLFEFMDKQGVEICKRNLKRRESGIKEEHDFEFLRKDGTRIYTRMATSPLTDDEGKYVGAIAGILDITKHKKAEEALRESEQRYRGIVELAPDGIVTIDLKGVITSVNPAFLQLTGFSKNEIVGKHFTRMGTIRARDIPRYLKLMSSSLKGKLPSKFEFSYVRKNGTVGLAEGRFGFLRKDGKTIGIQGILREITEQRKAQKTIEESRQRFEHLFMGNPEAAVHVDSDYRILDINPRFTKLFGYSLDEVKGKHINDVVVPKDHIREAETLDRRAKKGLVFHDTVRKAKGGTLIPVSISIAPLIIEGKILGYIAQYKDISQVKKAEKELRETLGKLETMNEKLGVVGGLTRHDARNKLATVTMNAFMLKRRLAHDTEALKHLSAVESACDEVERIFDFARIYEKIGVEELAYINVGMTVEETVQLFPDLHEVKVANDCQALTVLTDSLLRQLFYNLIDNSLKHGEKVSRIRVYCETKKDKLELVYEDDGVGIANAEKEKIFMEGYGKDTGYGLYLIRKMCEVYGWAIRETGKHGKGAQFAITIPRTSKDGKANYRME